MASVVVAARVSVALLAYTAACRPAREDFRPATFDLAAARRTEDLAAVATPDPPVPRGGLRTFDVSYVSTEWRSDGSARPIHIHGFLAAPAGAGAGARERKPAVVVAHGLGGQADPQVAADLARNLDIVALAISAPGLGGSEGRAVTFADPTPLFDTVPDARGSWLHAYTHAILRAVTFLGSRDEVDPSAVFVTGVSMGGLAAFMAGGVDDRVAGILPVNAAGGWAAAAAAGSWLRNLVEAAAGRTLASPDVLAFMAAFDPLGFASRQHGAVYMLAGAQDEFFPIDQITRTFTAVRAPAKSLALLADFDHEWYFATGCPAACMPGAPAPAAVACPATCPTACPPGARWPYCGPHGSYDRHADFIARWALLLRALTSRQAVPPRHAFAPPPAAPELRREGAEIIVRVAGPAPVALRLAISDNGGFTYGQFPLARGRDGVYRFDAGALPNDAIVFAEAEADSGAVATSVPALPPGFRPNIRPYQPVRR